MENDKSEIAPADQPFLTAAELQKRWRVSGMYLLRLRRAGRISVMRIAKRSVLYALADVLKIEAESMQSKPKKRESYRVLFDRDEVILDSLHTETKRPWVVIMALMERSGFDNWWESIDDDVKDEIFEELRKRLSEI